MERKGSYSYRIIHVAFDICSTVTAPGIWILCTIGICAHAYKITVNKIYKYVSEEVHFDITLWIFIILVTCLCCLLERKWEVTVSGVASLGIRVLSFLQTTYSWHQNWAITATSLTLSFKDVACLLPASGKWLLQWCFKITGFRQKPKRLLQTTNLYTASISMACKHKSPRQKSIIFLLFLLAEYRYYGHFNQQFGKVSTNVLLLY